MYKNFLDEHKLSEEQCPQGISVSAQMYYLMFYILLLVNKWVYLEKLLKVEVGDVGGLEDDQKLVFANT